LTSAGSRLKIIDELMRGLKTALVMIGVTDAKTMEALPARSNHVFLK
jgi:hypothetical protein